MKTDANHLSKRCVDNPMKLNGAKCHFMLFGNNSPGISVIIGSSDKEKLLGITLDKNLAFTCHVEGI